MVSVFLLGSKVNSGHHMPTKMEYEGSNRPSLLKQANTEMVFVHRQQAAQDGYL